MNTYTVQIGIFQQEAELFSFRFEVRAAGLSTSGRKVVESGRKLVEKPHEHRLGVDVFGWFVLGVLVEQEKEILIQN